MKKLNEKGFLIAIDIMINSWNTKVKVKEFLKKTRVTLRKVRKDTHITTKSARQPPLLHILSTTLSTLLFTLNLVFPSVSRAWKINSNKRER
jgi:hypothetical protein